MALEGRWRRVVGNHLEPRNTPAILRFLFHTEELQNCLLIRNLRLHSPTFEPDESSATAEAITDLPCSSLEELYRIYQLY
jgi:hypothetical protein